MDQCHHDEWGKIEGQMIWKFFSNGIEGIIRQFFYFFSPFLLIKLRKKRQYGINEDKGTIDV